MSGGSLHGGAMNAARIRFVTLVVAATLATRALGQTDDHIAACYGPSTTVRLSNSGDIVLNQNSPNPFAEETTITYKLPDTSKTAKMLFYDAQGALIKAVDLTSRRSRSDDCDDEIAECAGECRLKTGSGGIKVARSGEADLATGSGAVAAERVDGAKVKAGSGNVIVGLAGPGRLDVKALSGSVTVSVPHGTQPSTRLKALSGDVRCDCPDGGEGEIRVKTLSGNIEVVER